MKILAVVVIYNRRPAESTTLQTLLRSRAYSAQSSVQADIFVWDNSPNAQRPIDLPVGTLYVSAPHNPGLSVAYNHALGVAEANGYDWLLTLDQDTGLPIDFLARLGDISDRVTEDPNIAAILPLIVGNAKRLSPFHFVMEAIPQTFPHGFVGVPPYATYAVNSAATVRVACIRRIEGYNALFPLDISDIDLFHRIALAGMSVYVAGDVIVSHDFSLLDKVGRMSLDRYRSMLRDECAFWDLNMGAFGRTERLGRLAGRICKDLFRPGTWEFLRITGAELLRRLVTPRSVRIRKWRDWANLRRSSSITSAFALSLTMETLPSTSQVDPENGLRSGFNPGV